jgi:hypothetical protein
MPTTWKWNLNDFYGLFQYIYRLHCVNVTNVHRPDAQQTDRGCEQSLQSRKLVRSFALVFNFRSISIYRLWDASEYPEAAWRSMCIARFMLLGLGSRAFEVPSAAQASKSCLFSPRHNAAQFSIYTPLTGKVCCLPGAHRYDQNFKWQTAFRTLRAILISRRILWLLFATEEQSARIDKQRPHV